MGAADGIKTAIGAAIVYIAILYWSMDYAWLADLLMTDILMYGVLGLAFVLGTFGGSTQKEDEQEIKVRVEQE
ncbi:hypothetical protein N0B31_18685 [Salinirubellus salinus]|uniref:Uncharacterized protein n=1 Tax=Salinirubellus salinus TaxID=1364945 RepID=A0A9E7R3S6_9EURY|nr:hypothetical protein [Salinirubellus salinus]UWM54130.1 hypothetical protein N0B31_18685 [Salinirubellus salinus]